jgi:hypothetical protein
MECGAVRHRLVRLASLGSAGIDGGLIDRGLVRQRQVRLPSLGASGTDGVSWSVVFPAPSGSAAILGVLRDRRGFRGAWLVRTGRLG